MQKKIGNRDYNTEKAKEVGRQSIGYFGDSYGFEEVLYRKTNGEFFLFCVGGENSQYPEDDIFQMDEDATREWLVRVCGADYAEKILSEKAPESKPASKNQKASAVKTASARKATAKKPATKKAAVKSSAKKSTAEKSSVKKNSKKPAVEK